ncbi:MAG: hypothetical protein CMB80_08015 [Flammeovirgaceae bacterium]|nr:hypothetical protein [Flammeovirgaceae bacterium]|tara:strand:+ start:3573 stop:4274 length:702 start_codon:yes stop_codon:yes gene_type:complete
MSKTGGSWGPLRKTLRIRSNPKGTSWCGPSVLTAIIGRKYEYVEKFIQDHRGNKIGFSFSHGIVRIPHPKSVRGMTHDEMIEFLHEHGLNSQLYKIKVRSEDKVHYDARDLPSLAKWLRERPPELRKCTMVVHIAHHYILVRGCKVWDNCTAKKGVPLSKYHRRKAKVHGFIPVNKDWKPPSSWNLHHRPFARHGVVWDDIKKQRGKSKGLPEHLKKYNREKNGWTIPGSGYE